MAKYNLKSLTQISFIRLLHSSADGRVGNQFRMFAKGVHSKEPRDIVYSYQPIYYFSRFFGLLPFSLAHDSNGELQAPKIRIFDGFWFIISILVYLAITNVSLLRTDIQKYPQSLPILILGNEFLLVFGLIYGVIMIIENMCSRFKFVRILKTFINFDREVS